MRLQEQYEKRRRHDEQIRRLEKEEIDEKRRQHEKEEREMCKAELETFKLQLEQHKKDREGTERRLIEMSNTPEEARKQASESRKQEELERIRASRRERMRYSFGKGTFRSRKSRTEKGIGFLQSRIRDAETAIRAMVKKNSLKLLLETPQSVPNN